MGGAVGGGLQASWMQLLGLQCALLLVRSANAVAVSPMPFTAVRCLETAFIMITS